MDLTNSKTQVLILAPTREFAQQIRKVVLALGDFLKVECMACIGATSVRENISRLEKGVQVIVGTPGRVLDVLTRRHISTCVLLTCLFACASSSPLFTDVESIKMFVFDEADEMFSRGFKVPIYDIFRLLPSSTQVVLLSATMPAEVLEVTKKFMREPVRILVKKEELTLEGIRQFYISVDKEEGSSTPSATSTRR